MLRYLTAGESHGPCLTAIIEGLPSGLYLTSDHINRHLKRRQLGYGRGERMKLEQDEVKILSGLRFNETLGSPVALQIENKDHVNWLENMAVEGDRNPTVRSITSPRPGHADFAAGVKYMREDLRDILERSSARETAIRTAVGSVARRMLWELGVRLFSHVVSIGNVEANYSNILDSLCLKVEHRISLENGEEHNVSGEVPELARKIDSSPLRCADYGSEANMIKVIDEARRNGDTLGGVFEVVITGVPPGIGSHVHPDRRLDARLAGAFMSLQGIKGVEIGLGFKSATLPGSKVHDPFYYNDDGDLCRSTNNGGGIEGGVSNGMPIVIRVAMKPIPTLLKPLPSVDLNEHKETLATVERSDVCAVPAASVVGEAIATWELAVAIREKFAGDSMDEMITSYESYMDMVKSYLQTKDKR